MKRAWTAFVIATAAAQAPAHATVAADPDAVVKLVHISIEDLQNHDRDGAAAALDSALAIVESTHGAGPEAAKARSLWYEEGCKVFKGEPYERCMMYYYRGLLHLWKGDFGNASACFSNGILQDAFAEEAQYRCDFGLLYFLSVFSAKLAGRQAEDDERDLVRLRPDAPKIDGTSVLVICETGKGPRKLADGVGHYELKLRRGKNFRTVGAKIVTADSSVIPAYPMEDIAFQAMTRGGRPIDAILRGKVQFRDNAADIGSTLSAVSTTAMLTATVVTRSSGAFQGAGAAAGALGAIADFAAIKSRPHADIRAWDNLPDTVHVALVPRAVVHDGFTVQFLDSGGMIVATVQMGGPADDTSRLLWCRNSE